MSVTVCFECNTGLEASLVRTEAQEWSECPECGSRLQSVGPSDVGERHGRRPAHFDRTQRTAEIEPRRRIRTPAGILFEVPGYEIVVEVMSLDDPSTLALRDGWGEVDAIETVRDLHTVAAVITDALRARAPEMFEQIDRP